MGRHSSIGAAAFVYFALATSPSFGWFDAGEIAAEGAALGLLHPPGAAGFLPLAHLATALPLGPLGFRIALVSAVFGAACVSLTTAIWSRRGASLGLCIVGAAWLCLGSSFARQARVAEVYTFGAFLVAATAWGFDPAVPESRRLHYRGLGTLAAVTGAWAFGDLRLALGLPIAVGWAWALHRRQAWARLAPTWVVMASLPALALAFAEPSLPGLNEVGRPDAAGRWWAWIDATVRRGAEPGAGFSALHGVPGLDGGAASAGFRAWLHHAARSLEALAEDLGPLGPLLAFVAVVERVRPLGGIAKADAIGRADRRLVSGVALIFLLELAYAVVVHPSGTEGRETGMIAAWCCVLVVGTSAAARLPGRGRMQFAVLPLVASLCVLPAALMSVGDARVTRSWGPHAWTARVFDAVEPGALVLVHGGELAAGWRALHGLEGVRPDISVVASKAVVRAGLQPGASGVDGVGEPSTDPRLSAAWRAAESACGGREGLRAFVQHWEGPVYVESPGLDAARIFEADLRTPPPLGRLVEATRARPPEPLGPDELRVVLEHALDRGLETMPTVQDRRRLAAAVSARVRAWLRVAPETPETLATAQDVYRDLLARTRLELPSTLVSLGALEARAGRHDEAIRITRRALELEPGRRLALLNLALYLGRSEAGREEARQLLERAAELHPDDAATWRRLAELCETSGDTACTTRASQQALRAGEFRRDDARQRCLEAKGEPSSPDVVP